MKKKVVIAAALAAVVCATVVRSQDPPRPGGPRGMGGTMMACPMMAVMPPQAAMCDRMAEALQLTDDQAAKINDIATKGDETIRPLMRKAGDSSKALREALLASDFDARKVKELAATAEKAEVLVVSASIDEWTQIRAILTADQIKTLQEIMSTPHPGPGGPPPAGTPVPPPAPVE